jgi:tRNA(Ile)-lysidine synthetase-like protein
MSSQKISTIIAHLASLPTPLIIGVSGGVDSMVLLNLAIQAVADRNTSTKSAIIVCHIDHQIRAESSSDAEFVRAYCHEQVIHCEIASMNVPKIAKESKESLESTGRRVRYAFFEQIRALEWAVNILTAHHLDDSIETVLLNLTRGARLRGLSGIQAQYGAIIRPLLPLSKAEIREYAEEHAIPYREDATNTDPNYPRNRIRGYIIPEMEAINPSIRETLNDFAQYARDLDILMENILAVHLSGSSITEREFIGLAPILQRTLIERLYSIAHDGSNIGLSNGNIEEIRRFILEANGGTIKSLGHLELVKKHGVVMWGRALPLKSNSNSSWF